MTIIKRFLAFGLCFSFSSQVISNELEDPFDEDFEPIFRFKVGANSEGLDSFNYEGHQISSSALFSLALDYQFTQSWSATLSHSHSSECFLFCSPNSIVTDDQAIELRYSNELYQLTFNYNKPISDRVTAHFNFGVIRADESFNLRTCAEYVTGIFDAYCAVDWENESRRNQEHAALVGVGLNFQMFKHWDLQVSTKASNLRDGYHQTGLSVGYRF